MRGQERGKLRDISGIYLESKDCFYMVILWQQMLNGIIEYEDVIGYRDFFNILDDFYNKIKFYYYVSDYYVSDYYVIDYYVEG